MMGEKDFWRKVHTIWHFQNINGVAFKELEKTISPLSHGGPKILVQFSAFELL